MSAPGTGGIGLKRLQHLVLWVSDVEQSVHFYRDILGFEVKTRYPNAAFMRIPGSPDDHHLGLFEQRGATGPDERVRPHVPLGVGGRRADRPRARASPARRGRRPGGPVGSRREPVALCQGPRRARVRGVLDGARRRAGPDARARPGARAGPPGHRDARRCEVLINRVIKSGASARRSRVRHAVPAVLIVGRRALIVRGRFRCPGRPAGAPLVRSDPARASKPIRGKPTPHVVPGPGPRLQPVPDATESMLALPASRPGGATDPRGSAPSSARSCG